MLEFFSKLKQNLSGGEREINICRLERKHRFIMVKIINTDKMHRGLQWVFVWRYEKTFSDSHQNFQGLGFFLIYSKAQSSLLIWKKKFILGSLMTHSMARVQVTL